MAYTTEVHFLTVPEAAKSKIKVLADLVSSKGSLPGVQMASFLLHPHMVEREQPPGVFFNLGTNPIRSGLSPTISFNFHYLLKTLTLKYSHIGC
jgi:hypothetical protein